MKLLSSLNYNSPTSIFEVVVWINDDLSDLKYQGGNKKAAITRSKTFIQSLATTIDKLDLSELQWRLDKLLLAIKHFIILSCRLAQVDGKIFDMDDDEDAKLAENCLVTKLFLNKKAAIKVSIKGKYISQKLEHIVFREKDSSFKSRQELKKQESKLDHL